MNRGLVVFRGVILILFIGAALQAGGGAVSGAANPPGTMTVSPAALVEGTSGNRLTFTYATGGVRLLDGTLSVKVPTGWTQPQTHHPGEPGSVGTNAGTLSVVNRHIHVKDVTLCKHCSLALTYSDATAPASSGTATFVTKVATAGQPLEPLTPAPTVEIESTSCVPTSATTVGPPSMTANPGTCLNGGSVVTLTGSGYDVNSLGSVLECNSDPNQPTVHLPLPINQNVPVSCSGIAIANAKSTTASGDLPAGLTFTIISPTPGPPCGAGYEITTCPADSSGGSAATDAAAYPCPPTAAQLAAHDSCILVFNDEGGKVGTVPISFGASSSNSEGEVGVR